MKVIPAAGLVVDAAVPEWIAPSFRITEGVDPLGLQTLTTDRIIPRLLPGVLALTLRARYLSFYAWLLRRYAEQKRVPTSSALSEFIKSREYDFALAVKLCPRNCGSSPIGARRANLALVPNATHFARDWSVESVLGGYGLYYRTPMRILGLAAGEGTALGESFTAVDVLRPDDEHASDLATSFADAVSGTAYARDFVDSTEPIPIKVLVEYASHACLCRLPDFPAERAAIRAALLSAGGHTEANEVSMRRQGFALFLRLLEDSPDIGESDTEFRRSVWRAYSNIGPRDKPSLRDALSRWAAVAAAHFFHDGMTLLWEDAGPVMKSLDRGTGVAPADLVKGLRGLADLGRVQLPKGSFVASATRPTSDLIDELAEVPADLPDFVDWARKDRRAVAGFALMLATNAALPRESAAGEKWTEVARIDGERQPGLSQLSLQLNEHLEENPDLGDSLKWAVEQFVIRPHETIAYSKLPEFTFRFRWESGRLVFYTHPFDWAGSGDIRARTLGSLTRDLGFWIAGAKGPKLTAEGAAFVREVFGKS